jgi:hypothetical protein
MLLTREPVTQERFVRATGWSLEPRGACRGGVCVPLPAGSVRGDRVDVEAVAERLGMPLVRHSDALAALGPATTGGRVLASAEAPALVLPHINGAPFDLATLRGQKVALVAWSPY